MKNNTQEVRDVIEDIVLKANKLIVTELVKNRGVFITSGLFPPQILSTIVGSLAYVLVKEDPFFCQKMLEDWILTTSKIILSYQLQENGEPLPDDILIIENSNEK